MSLFWLLVGVFLGTLFGFYTAGDCVDDEGYCSTCGHWDDDDCPDDLE